MAQTGLRMGEVYIDGLDELINAFEELPKESEKYMRKAANEAGNVVLLKAKSKVRVSTDRISRDGSTDEMQHLRDALKLTRAGKSTKRPYRFVATIGVKKGHSYYIPLELGHLLVVHGKTVGTVQAYPFMRPAADESRDEVQNILTTALNRALNEFGD